jgi:acetyl esterase/lipase
MKLVTRAFAIASLVLAAPGFGQDKLMGPHDLQAIAARPADAISRYGADAEQFGELRVPNGRGPHPVVVLIHGGCFKAAYATLSDLAPIGDALKAQGIATWNVEYRRLGRSGGGWPGTYRDVGAAIDHLRTLAPRHRLGLRRVVIVGHSGGGHLALWTTARGRMPAKSGVGGGRPLRPAGVINLAGPINLNENIAHYEEVCGGAVVTQMMGGTPEQVPARYRATSAAALLPLGVPQLLFWGEHESYVPRPFAETYVARARAAGDAATLRVVPGAGHFEIASPQSAAWPVLLSEIRRLLRMP